MSKVIVLAGPIIRAGEALSDPLDCTMGQIVRIHTPTNWKAVAQPSPLSFQISVDGAPWYDLFDVTGHEVTVQTIIPGTAVLIQVHRLSQVWIKFRSGWRANPLPQPAECSFSVAVELASSPASPGIPALPPIEPVVWPTFTVSLKGQVTAK